MILVSRILSTGHLAFQLNCVFLNGEISATEEVVAGAAGATGVADATPGTPKPRIEAAEIAATSFLILIFRHLPKDRLATSFVIQRTGH